jgi:hypothetical protein
MSTILQFPKNLRPGAKRDRETHFTSWGGTGPICQAVRKPVKYATSVRTEVTCKRCLATLDVYERGREHIEAMVSTPDVRNVEDSYTPADAAPIEAAMLRAMLKCLRNAGFVPVDVWDGESYVYGGKGAKPGSKAKPARVLTVREVIDPIYTTSDKCTLHFAPDYDLGAWGELGLLITRGGGLECVYDWHVHREGPFERFTAAVERLCDAVGKGDIVVTIETRE